MTNFAESGISLDRISFFGKTPFEHMLQCYHDIDIALDTFPFSGGMTTTLALWMGCPVITCPGETFASRQSLSYLSAIGLTEVIASSPADYIEKAQALAGNLPVMAKIRQALRDRIISSPFHQTAALSTALSDALKKMWIAYCEA